MASSSMIRDMTRGPVAAQLFRFAAFSFAVIISSSFMVKTLNVIWVDS